MLPRHTPVMVVAAVVAALAGSAPAAAEDAKPRPGASRDAIFAIETLLGRAVDRVSPPHAARLVGSTFPARGYRLPGYGLVFVLTPRALPSGEKGAFVFRMDSPRRRVVRVETRRRAEAPAAPLDEEQQEIEILERQVLSLQAETEEARRAAEEEMARLVHDVRIRLTPAPPLPPDAPKALSPRAVDDAPLAPEPPEAPLPPQPPEAPLPPPPPWKFWFEAGAPQDDRTPEALVADVRAAVIEALAIPVEKLSDLGGDDFLTVAVDFVPGGFFASYARPQRTLVVRARVRDVEARGRGAITLEELRRRVLVVDY